MPGSTDLKAEIADSWKTVWKVEPLPFSVPLRLVLLLADADALLLVVDVLLVVDDELEEEHAARATAQTASPAVVTCRLRRRCIIGYSFYGVFGFGPPRAARSSCKPWCASTVWRRSRYRRVNVRWIKRG
jgi:hypothetical protein